MVYAKRVFICVTIVILNSIGDKNLKMAVSITNDMVKLISLKEKMALDLFLSQPKKVSSFANYTPSDAVAFFLRLGVYRGPIEDSVASCEALSTTLNSLGPSKKAEIEEMIESKKVGKKGE